MTRCAEEVLGTASAVAKVDFQEQHFEQARAALDKHLADLASAEEARSAVRLQQLQEEAERQARLEADQAAS
jgi:hypothetical protein